MSLMPINLSSYTNQNVRYLKTNAQLWQKQSANKSMETAGNLDIAFQPDKSKCYCHPTPLQNKLHLSERDIT